LKTLTCVMIGLLCVAAGGCAAKKKGDGSKVPLDRGVTDVSPTSGPAIKPPDPSFVYVPASASQPRFVPVDAPPPTGEASAAAMAMPAPVTPVAAPVMTETPAPRNVAPVTASAAGASRQYKVQKGDTLFRIAKSHYGTGGRWQQIASANPGLTPSTLKAGATIVVP
jgi:5'-nucleotidase